MFQKAIYPKTREVLNKLAIKEELKSFYLAGGTALAIQLGHRESIDLDFFSAKFPKIESLKSSLSNLNMTVVNENYNTLDCTIDNVKLTFLEYNYPLVGKIEIFENTKLASIIDIACMKISAISSRGTKKDFVDLYYILKQYTLIQILEYFEMKYIGVSYNLKHIIRSLTYFTDADSYPDIVYLNNKVDWEEIKTSITKEVKRILPKD